MFHIQYHFSKNNITETYWNNVFEYIKIQLIMKYV